MHIFQLQRHANDLTSFTPLPMMSYKNCLNPCSNANKLTGSYNFRLGLMTNAGIKLNWFLWFFQNRLVLLTRWTVRHEHHSLNTPEKVKACMLHLYRTGRTRREILELVNHPEYCTYYLLILNSNSDSDWWILYCWYGLQFPYVYEAEFCQWICEFNAQRRKMRAASK